MHSEDNRPTSTIRQPKMCQRGKSQLWLCKSVTLPLPVDMSAFEQYMAGDGDVILSTIFNVQSPSFGTGAL